MSTNEDIAKVLAGHYAAIEVAFKARNVDAVARLLADDFVVSQRDGTKLAREGAIEAFRQQMGAFEDVTWPRKVTALEVDGDLATATVEGVFGATTRDNGNRAVRLEVRGVAVDVWRRSGDAWLNVGTRSESQVVTIDGQPIDP